MKSFLPDPVSSISSPCDTFSSSILLLLHLLLYLITQISTSLNLNAHFFIPLFHSLQNTQTKVRVTSKHSAEDPPHRRFSINNTNHGHGGERVYDIMRKGL
ncbi:hypothetical protein L2E82_10458 [Cichorium intybus]|uniref:Uncharacterized protein n=1 Tax=Cichorium intybus TaxID=13427 RepID=A0ACB9GCM4_CICIN|nr:hypothetical protein L2E82_10458 [Cichorium intybus]